MYRLSLFIILCILSSYAYAYAAGPADSADTPLDIHKFVLNDITYVGFLEKDAQTLLQYRIDIPKLNLKIVKLEEKIVNNELQMEKLASANNILLETKQFLIVENSRLQQELINSTAWYRNPYLLFSFGLLVGTAATIAVVYLVK